MAVVTSFDEVLFDPNIIAAGGAGSPEFANTIIKNPATGIYKVNINRYDPVETWFIDLGLLTDAQREYVSKFWRGGYGSAYGFRCRIASDFKVTAEVIGTGNGVQTVFPLTKTYTRPGTTGHANIRRITKPVAVANLTGGSATLYEADGVTPRVVPALPTGTGKAFKVYKDAVNQAAGWTVHNTTGNITFTVAPANGVVISWDGEFDTPVRFLQNSFQQKVNGMESEITGLNICEILPAELGLT